MTDYIKLLQGAGVPTGVVGSRLAPGPFSPSRRDDADPDVVLTPNPDRHVVGVLPTQSGAVPKSVSRGDDTAGLVVDGATEAELLHALEGLDDGLKPGTLYREQRPFRSYRATMQLVPGGQGLQLVPPNPQRAALTVVVLGPRNADGTFSLTGAGCRIGEGNLISSDVAVAAGPWTELPVGTTYSTQSTGELSVAAVGNPLNAATATPVVVCVVEDRFQAGDRG